MKLKKRTIDSSEDSSDESTREGLNFTMPSQNPFVRDAASDEDDKGANEGDEDDEEADESGNVRDLIDDKSIDSNDELHPRFAFSQSGDEDANSFEEANMSVDDEGDSEQNNQENIMDQEEFHNQNEDGECAVFKEATTNTTGALEQDIQARWFGSQDIEDVIEEQEDDFDRLELNDDELRSTGSQFMNCRVLLTELQRRNKNATNEEVDLNNKSHVESVLKNLRRVPQRLFTLAARQE
jgi:hypothetical protein